MDQPINAPRFYDSHFKTAVVDEKEMYCGLLLTIRKCILHWLYFTIVSCNTLNTNNMLKSGFGNCNVKERVSKFLKMENGDQR